MVGGVGAWGARFGGWADVLGLGGLVLGLCGLVSGLGVMGFGNVVLGFGVGQVGFAGWWGRFWGSMGCVGTWGIGIWDWRGGRGLGWADFGFWRAVLGCSVPATKQLSTSETIKKIDKRKKNTHKRARKPTKQNRQTVNVQKLLR